MNKLKNCIHNKSGFTLVEMLVALFCLSFCLSILCAITNVLAHFPKECYTIEDTIAIRQLQHMLIESEQVHIENQSISYLYRGTLTQLHFQQQRLVKTPGYEILLKDIQEGTFQKEGACLYALWERKHQNKALLYCE